MDAEYSQICEHAVPILLHCVTLPIGADVFWKQIEEEFHNPDWRSRFTAGKNIQQKYVYSLASKYEMSFVVNIHLIDKTLF